MTAHVACAELLGVSLRNGLGFWGLRGGNASV